MDFVCVFKSSETNLKVQSKILMFVNALIDLKHFFFFTFIDNILSILELTIVDSNFKF